MSKKRRRERDEGKLVGKEGRGGVRSVDHFGVSIFWPQVEISFIES